MILQALLNELTVQSLLIIVFGVAVGIVFGAIPGLTANMAVSLCLPLSFGMDPVHGTTLLISLYLGGISGGLISSILLKIPGTPASIATCFDGAPMAERGEAGKALGTGIVSSFIGGLFSIIILIFISPTLAKIALKFGPYEYCAVGIFSLTLVSGLIGGSLVKGVIAAVIGLMLSTVGAAPIDGAPRFTFGITALSSGFDTVAVMIGLFAVAEIMKEARQSAVRSEKVKALNYKIKGFGITFRELVGQKWNMLRSAAIGTLIGILPGLGGSTANLISYSVAKNQSKHPEKFGTGILDGIVASETSNNATVGGALVPLLAMGIPGDITTALLLGALTMHGITAGPLLFTTNGDLVYGIFVALNLANIAMFVLMFAGMRGFVKMLSLPKRFLLPVVMTLCLVGAFAINNRMFDVWCVLGFGIVGCLLDSAGIPFAPLIMGFILGPIIELYLRRASMMDEGDLSPFLTRPIPCAFLVFTVLFFVFIVIWEISQRRRSKGRL